MILNTPAELSNANGLTPSKVTEMACSYLAGHIEKKKKIKEKCDSGYLNDRMLYCYEFTGCSYASRLLS